MVVERARNWTSFSSPWARAWDGHEVVDLAVGRLALHYAEENPDEVVAALDDKTEAVEVRERARLVTWLVGEDREAVMGEFVELHRLHTAEPNLNMMPGHDSAELTCFLKAGLLTKGF